LSIFVEANKKFFSVLCLPLKFIARKTNSAGLSSPDEKKLSLCLLFQKLFSALRFLPFQKMNQFFLFRKTFDILKVLINVSHFYCEYKNENMDAKCKGSMLGSLFWRFWAFWGRKMTLFF
jgi:hypothetical protein